LALLLFFLLSPEKTTTTKETKHLEGFFSLSLPPSLFLSLFLCFPPYPFYLVLARNEKEPRKQSIHVC
jgi:hypothetical protein